MSTTGKSLTQRIFSRISTTWSEMDYAQRRMLEVQSGVSGLTRSRTRYRR